MGKQKFLFLMCFLCFCTIILWGPVGKEQKFLFLIVLVPVGKEENRKCVAWYILKRICGEKPRRGTPLVLTQPVVIIFD